MQSGSGTESAPYTIVGGYADYETAVLGYAKVNGAYVISSNVKNNTNMNTECIIYSAVYSKMGELKKCGMAKAHIGANNDMDVNITVGCDIESGDVIKTFMWNDNMKSLTKVTEMTVE